MNKILTIGIPTYNRCEHLKNNLRQLLPQAILYKDQVEVVVSDNCSPDDTKSIVASFTEDYNEILIYNRNETNEGYLFNFGKCVELSSAKYICLIGDDDEVVYGYISTVLSMLKENDIGVLHYNFFTCSPTTNKLSAFYSNREFVSIFEYYKDSGDFIKTFLNGPSFMSSIVFKRDIWLYGKNRFEENCYGYDWLMKVYAVMKGRSCGYYSIPLVIQHISPLQPYGDLWAKYSVIGMYRIFGNLEADYPGICDIWQNKQKHNDRLYFTLLNTYRNKKMYKGFASEMKASIASKSQLITFYVAIFSPSVVVKYSIFPFFYTFLFFRKTLGSIVKILKRKFLNR